MKKTYKVFLFACISLSLVFGADAKSASSSVSPPRLDHILLEVTNMQASIVFYRDMLHLTPKSLDKSFSTMSAGNVDIYLSTAPWGWKKPQAKNERLGLGMYPHFEFDNVTDLVAHIKKAGYTIIQEPKEYDWGTEAFVSDPDGYTWALIHLKK